MSDSAGPRLLVVEDDQLLRVILSRALRRAGFECEAAEDGQVGLDRLRTSSYDLIVTDMRMPRMSGLQMIQAAREEFHDLPPVVVLSGFHDHSDEALVDAGIGKFLAKPVTTQELVGAVWELLGDPR